LLNDDVWEILSVFALDFLFSVAVNDDDILVNLHDSNALVDDVMENDALVVLVSEPKQEQL
jgi:hypothetical protein